MRRKEPLFRRSEVHGRWERSVGVRGGGGLVEAPKGFWKGEN